MDDPKRLIDLTLTEFQAKHLRSLLKYDKKRKKGMLRFPGALWEKRTSAEALEQDIYMDDALVAEIDKILE